MKNVAYVVSCLLMLAPISIFGKTLVKLTAQQEIIQGYSELTKNKECHQITDFTNVPHRGIVELIFTCKILHDIATIELVKAPNYSRSLALVAEGYAMMPVESIWKVEVPKSGFYVSEPVIEEGEFEVGLYTTPSNKAVQNIKSKNDLKDFSAVSSENWKIDWQILNSLNLKNVYSVPKLEQMAIMVDNNRADFLLWKFSGRDDLASDVAGYNLIPVKGVKIALKGSRHFIISKKHPDSEKIFQTLNMGLKKVRESRELQEAFYQSGFFNKRVKDWITLNSD
ncbi:hypothetical protein [Spartinivicinus ruber]|uniref:hypothetical protein n=1 Tax=Spartinivicinus ruber TaxID=2683272 RepID=UPI0013D6AEF0|nr:hypothetical protein [Spartinivicinus ruber]